MLLLLTACVGVKPDPDSARPDPVDTGDPCVPTVQYLDLDADGHGNAAESVESCEPREGYVANGDDCEDTMADRHPGAAERCNGADDDCDGETDEDAADAQTWYADDDGDGHGDPATPAPSCSAPAGFVSVGDDCDDGDPAVSPEGVEACNGLDDDCDGETDEDGPLWYADADFDGYGDPGSATRACEAPEGTVANAEDCDDTTAGVYPGATDRCDATDNDCDGDVDEDVKAGWTLVSIDNQSGTIWAIDRATGAVTEYATITSGPTTGSVNSMDVRDDGTAIAHHNDGTLYEVDVCAGVLTELGATGVGDMGGITFGSGGQLFGIDQDNDTVVLIDVATGVGLTGAPSARRSARTASPTTAARTACGAWTGAPGISSRSTSPPGG